MTGLAPVMSTFEYFVSSRAYDKIVSTLLRTLTATRYVTPLREGGSLPAIVEAEDDGLYVLKFRGAGQGPKSLIAELVAGEIARALGLMVPEIVFMELDVALGRNEPDYEIYNLIKASVGLNLALLRTLTATRYVTPLREGGSLPRLSRQRMMVCMSSSFAERGKARNR